jgi:hypothetical protein
VRTFGFLLWGRGRRSYTEFVVDVKEGVAEGVEGEEGGLEVAVEVDGGVVGDEGSAEVKVPSHFLLL